MSRWDSTYAINRVTVSDGAVAEVWTAISDAGNLVAKLEIYIRSGNGNACASIELTSAHMIEVAAMLVRHAARSEELKHELDYLNTEAA